MYLCFVFFLKLKGFHVHVYGVNEDWPNCTAAGAHFNPYSIQHIHLFN